jgi:hypothetical protein
MGGFGGRINFRGFLYVMGNLIVAGPWHIAGVVRVDGQIQGDHLTIYYDDQVNHAILTKPFELMIDSVKDLPS